MSLLGGRAYWLIVGMLAIAIGLAAGLVLIKVVPDLEAASLATPRPSATALPGLKTPAPSPSEIDMNGALIPANSDCSGCHLTNVGVIGLRPIPAMGHPLEGWSQCTACHAPSGLVQTAPGHRGIHANECLTCHQPGNLPAPLSRPHRALQNMDCLDCHGKVAPLPADMTHRSQKVCWLCHRLPDVAPPVPAHATVTGETDCLSCHVAGKVGALPKDHASRRTSECLLCHELPLPGASAGPSDRPPGAPSPAASPTASPGP